MKNIARIGAIAIFVTFIFVFVEVYLFLNTAPTSEREERIFMVESGAPFFRIAKQLKSNGLITHDLKFYFLARWKGSSHKIKAGEYLLYTNLKPADILDMLVSGRTYLHRVTVPEGFNMFQIADVLSSLSLVPKTDFIRAVQDRDLLQKFNISGPSAEGYLFPESYYFSKPVTAEKVVETMIQRFQENYTEEIAFKAKKKGLGQKEVVILASLIEKETGIAEERRLISAVFHNRLKRGMKLQSDPTVIYGMYETFSGNLSRQHLRTPTPYNTYVQDGFPLGPIANPGKASLEAAADPMPVDYIYFVSRNDGSHHFSNNYRDHVNAVNRYQKKR